MWLATMFNRRCLQSTEGKEERGRVNRRAKGDQLYTWDQNKVACFSEWTVLSREDFIHHMDDATDRKEGDFLGDFMKYLCPFSLGDLLGAPRISHSLSFNTLSPRSL
jgi:hypothetical protein